MRATWTRTSRAPLEPRLRLHVVVAIGQPEAGGADVGDDLRRAAWLSGAAVSPNGTAMPELVQRPIIRCNAGDVGDAAISASRVVTRPDAELLDAAPRPCKRRRSRRSAARRSPWASRSTPTTSSRIAVQLVLRGLARRPPAAPPHHRRAGSGSRRATRRSRTRRSRCTVRRSGSRSPVSIPWRAGASAAKTAACESEEGGRAGASHGVSALAYFGTWEGRRQLRGAPAQVQHPALGTGARSMVNARPARGGATSSSSRSRRPWRDRAVSPTARSASRRRARTLTGLLEPEAVRPRGDPGEPKARSTGVGDGGRVPAHPPEGPVLQLPACPGP